MKKVIEVAKAVGNGIKVTALVGSCITIIFAGTTAGGYGALKLIKKVWIPFWTGENFDI